MTLAADLRSASRNVRRGGWLTATVVLMLAMAVGAVTAIFSIAHAVLIRPLPVADPDRVVLLWGRDDARSQEVVEVSLLDRRAWLAGQKSLSGIELFGSVNWGSCTSPALDNRSARCRTQCRRDSSTYSAHAR
jgi:hypothetical protein